jgi:hypothetical protein
MRDTEQHPQKSTEFRRNQGGPSTLDELRRPFSAPMAGILEAPPLWGAFSLSAPEDVQRNSPPVVANEGAGFDQKSRSLQDHLLDSPSKRHMSLFR